MRLTSSRDDLAEATRWAARQIPAKPTMPVLAGLLLEAEGDQLTVSGYDRESAGQATIAARVEEPGTVIVPGRLFTDIVTALPAGIVELDATEQEVTARLDDNQFRLPVMPDRDYPALPKAPVVSGSVDASLFAAAVADVSGIAMSQSDAIGAAQALGSVRITAVGEELTLASTDRYRIAIRTIPWTPEHDDTGSLLIPAPTVATAAKALAGADQVSLCFTQQGGGNVGLIGGPLTLVIRSTDTAFPNVYGLMPAEDAAAGCITVDPDELAKAAARASLVTDKGKPRQVRLTMRRDRIEVAARGDGPTGRGSVEADIDGLDDEYAAAFNVDYLASVLNPIDGPARIWLYGPTKPALIRPVDKDQRYTAVLMPVRLTHA
ncbi:DNA polymerase III subunit beta [Streptomyces kronopolitis]|uniref:DNA polymerase III subunit beta n=1 Tax=Streptomyces kronopolitis TaxID=1612435 RepID=UPI0034451AD1